MEVGLRIDVDTLKGHSQGVPNLYRLFAKHKISGSFFFSVGPDNMGRHLFRLLKPTFFLKMMRSSAASLYGWDILFKGTFWPGPIIGKKYPEILKECVKLGHELGLHAWDHHAWQSKIDNFSKGEFIDQIKKAYNLIAEAAATPPTCSAAPSWKITEAGLLAKEEFNFTYNSDCRGLKPFRPLVKGKILSQPQIPASLPTYDEVVGLNQINDLNYNQYILRLISESKTTPVLTIHAEVEGGVKAALFDQFISLAKTSGITFVPLRSLLPKQIESLPALRIVNDLMPGREGWVSFSEEAQTKVSANDN